ncbi:uncharacterized protein LOC110985781 isoform X2 [Acanthaster planci]|uniref:Uncharacterized protein LOC110985781 isoform X2 n=1 Tax=Acanthaster planci TaxID=133434 RepID=A0A8B7ZAS8_ACAPL|nr:uncharacterized protein LOC110985781 isoform X2 [Acanthaster planci]
MSSKVPAPFSNKTVLQLIVISYVFSVVRSQTTAAPGCPPPTPVAKLVQFINGVDVNSQSADWYPVGTRATAQCRSPGEMRLMGNRNGQTCRSDGKWSGQPPCCGDVTRRISVTGGAVQRVMPDGGLTVFVSSNTDYVEVRCSIDREEPLLEAPHITVDNVRVQMQSIRGDSGRVSYMTFSPVQATDSGEFGCRKSANPSSPNNLRIEFKEFSLSNQLQLNCPADIVQATDPGRDIATVTWPEPTALTTSEIVELNNTHSPGDIFPIGETTVVYSFKNAANEVAVCRFTITVIDEEKPTFLTCPNDFDVGTGPDSAMAVVEWAPIIALDNSRVISAPEGNYQSGTTFPTGETLVSYMARDEAGNVEFCNFTVSVSDKVSPVFADCPASQAHYLGQNETEVAVYWRRPAAGDNIDIVGPTVPSHTPGERFGLGTHTVTYTARDLAGNNGTCAFNVTIKIAQCQDEVTPFSEGVLTWTSAFPHELKPSLERCSVYTEKAGNFRALRECMPDEDQGAVWLEPRLNDCGEVRDSIDLDDLQKVSVGEGNVMEVSQAVAKTVSNMTSELADNLEPVASILQNIVNAGSPSVEVTEAVIETVDSVVMSVSRQGTLDRSGEDKEAPSSAKASSSIVQSLEAQISLVADDATSLEVTQRSLAVTVVTLKPYQQDEETQFLSVLDEDDPDSTTLQDGDVQTVPKKARGDSMGMSWPIDTSITMPADLGTQAAESLGYDDPGPLHVSFVLYQTDALFPLKNATGLFSVNTTGEYFTSGRVISATVEGVQLVNLSQPVIVEFTPHQDWNESIGVAECVFWDFSLDNGTGDWSSDGCSYVEFNEGRIVCHCKHLTNFAVLMAMKDESLTLVEQFVLDFISAVGCALSIAGVSLTLFTFIVFGNLRATRSRQILMHLCTALLCLYVAFLAGIDATENGAACTAVAAIIHYFTLASMCWMGVEAHNMYLLLVRSSRVGSLA